MPSSSILKKFFNQDVRFNSSAKKFLFFGIILFAFILRMVYAYKLPLNIDESRHLKIVKDCSLKLSCGDLTLGDLPKHPKLSLYIISVGLWLGHGSVFFVRFIFILLSIFGLVGLYRLTNMLFGYRIAMVALLLGAIDHHLVSLAPCFDEMGALFIAPWIMLQMYRCLNLNRRMDWLLLGLLFGVGYNYYEVVLLLLIPMIFYILVTHRFHYVVFSSGAYLAACILLLLMWPNIFANLRHEEINFSYIWERISHLGITPRFFILYFGNLLTCFKDSSWISISMYGPMYAPLNIPCASVAGLLYIGCLAYAVRFAKDARYSFLLLIVLGIAIPVSLVVPWEPWNNFWYLNFTIFPLIIFASIVAIKLLSSRRNAIIISLVFLYLIISVAFLLSGPKWFYRSPCWEKQYLSKMTWFLSKEYSGDGNREAARLTEFELNRHPHSAIVLFFKGILAATDEEKSRMFEGVIRLDPYNPLVWFKRIEKLMRNEEWHEAEGLLKKLEGPLKHYPQIYENLGYVEYRLHNFIDAEKQICQAIKIKPDNYSLYELLFLIRYAMGQKESADKALEVFARRCFVRHYEAYLRVAKNFASEGYFKEATIYRDKAIALGYRAILNGKTEE